jgi:hypothetical protein
LKARWAEHLPTCRSTYTRQMRIASREMHGASEQNERLGFKASAQDEGQNDLRCRSHPKIGF